MKHKWVLATLCVAVCATGCGGPAAATPASPPGGITTTFTKAVFGEIDVKSKAPANLWRAQLKTKGLSDVYVVDNKFAPHSDTGWHSHPGPSLIQVVLGTVTNYESGDRTCEPHVYTAGQGFIDAGGSDVHILRNETDSPAETIAVQIIPTDATRRIDATRPVNCPNF
jgi:quercetin dioxygenase-like cupin family protein